MLPTRLISLLALLIACVTSFADTSGMQVLDFYEFPTGSYNAIITNNSPASLPLRPVKLENLSKQEPVHAWWIHAQPDLLAQGDTGLVRFSVKRAKTKLDSVRMSFTDELSLVLSPGELPLLPVYLVQDATNSVAYLYLRNPGTESRQLSSITLEDMTSDHAPLTFAAGQVGVWKTKLGNWDKRRIGDLLLLTMTVDGKDRRAAVRMFDSADYRFLWEHEAEDAIACPTHQLGPWDEVGRRIFDAHTLNPTRPATVHFCRNRLPDGLAAFAQCTPRSIANLQASNLTRGQANPWPGWHGIADIVKSSTEPGIFTALIEDASQYSGAYGVPAAPEDPPLGEPELRSLLLLSVAKGSKGLLLRPNAGLLANPDDAAQSSATPLGPPTLPARSRFDETLHLLQGLLPWLSISEPAPMAISTKTPGVRTSALLCGTRGLMAAVVVEDPTSLPLNVKLDIQPPPGCPPPARWRNILDGSEGDIESDSDSLSLEFSGKSETSLLQISSDS